MSARPFSMAQVIGVCSRPSSSVARTCGLAPRSSRSVTISVCPSCTARVRGVTPCLFLFPARALSMPWLLARAFTKSMGVLL
jgi:hypothetical protein